MIEEFLEGEEASLFVLTDGVSILPFGSAQDHKRVGEGDTGPNTGGMGAYSPARVLTPELERRALDEIVRPTVAAMAAAGTPFSGVLYAGLMLTADGPKLIEYNTRFGDPECQVLMARLDEDLLEVLLAVATGMLAEHDPVRWLPRTALTVVMAANGYPGAPETGGRIDGLDDAGATGSNGFSGRHAHRGGRAGRSGRARAGRHCARRHRCSGAGGGVPGCRCDRLSDRLLSPRHRLARNRARCTLSFRDAALERIGACYGRRPATSPIRRST